MTENRDYTGGVSNSKDLAFKASWARRGYWGDTPCHEFDPSHPVRGTTDNAIKQTLFLIDDARAQFPAAEIRPDCVEPLHDFIHSGSF